MNLRDFIVRLADVLQIVTAEAGAACAWRVACGTNSYSFGPHVDAMSGILQRGVPARFSGIETNDVSCRIIRVTMQRTMRVEVLSERFYVQAWMCFR
ncbi:hypothetical protein P350_01365 [Burkholderia cepacia JBK9]|nr:hypothetical protein P350_01365 [Burkholderia cepacia JBK9]